MKIKIPAVLKKQTITQAALIIAVISFISKFFGFLREVLVAKYFGATSQTDAFLIALIIPSLILGIFSGGFANLIIPFYLGKKSRSLKEAYNFVNSVFLVWGIKLIILSILIFIFAPLCVRIFAYGFKGESFNLAVLFTRYLIISGYFIVMSGMFTGLIQAEKHFFFPVFITFIGNISLVFCLILLHNFLGIHSWTVGQISCWGLSFTSMLYLLYKRFNFFHNITIRQIEWGEIKTFTSLLIPLVISNGLSILHQVIDKTIASTLDAGSIAALNFANRIFQAPFNLFTIPIATAIYPIISELAQNRTSYTEYKNKLNKTISFLLYLSIPSTAYLFFLSKPIVKLLFERGAFDMRATSLTSIVLKMYSLGLFANSISPILARVFYSFKNTTTPLLISGICIFLNIILNIALSKILGAMGIALATSIVMIINLVLFKIFLDKYIKTFDMELIIYILKILFITIPICLICYASVPYLENSPSNTISGFIFLAVKLFLIFIISISTYFYLSYILKIESYFTLKFHLSNIYKKGKQIYKQFIF